MQGVYLSNMTQPQNAIERASMSIGENLSVNDEQSRCKPKSIANRHAVPESGSSVKPFILCVPCHRQENIPVKTQPFVSWEKAQ